MVEEVMVNVNQEVDRVSAAEFAAKFRSKKEVYNFLTVEANAYLCSHEALTIYFLKDLVMGRKKFIRNTDIQHLACPHFDSLTIEKLLEKAGENPQVVNYFPEQRDIGKLPRQWVANIAFTVIGQSFQDWVLERVSERNSKILQERKMFLDLDPEIAQVFKNSNSVSTSKGISAHLMKPGSKRRRTRKEMQQQTNFEEVAHMQIQEQQEKIEQLKEELRASQAEADNNRAASQILNEMIGRGDAEVGDDGSVNVTKRKQDYPNNIGNLSDQ